MNYIREKAQKDEDDFVECVRQVVKKYGVPEKMFLDTGGHIILKVNNEIRGFRTACASPLKQVARFFDSFNQYKLNRAPESEAVQSKK